MKRKVFNALCIATRSPYNRRFCWYRIPSICRAVEHAVKMGWALRTSVTQCEWREKGVSAARKKNYC